LMIQTTSFVSSFSQGSFEEVNQYFDKVNIYCMQVLGPDFNLKSKVNEILNGIQDFVLKSAAGIIGSIADAILGLFVMFFVIYYGFIEGKNWSSQIKDLLPLTKERKDKMAIEIKGVIHAVIYGQISIALLQGILGGLGFFIVGISNPVFWGFIMTILAFIPMTGTGFVWLPAGIIQLINGNILGGIFLLAYGFIIVSGIDNLIRPKIIAGKAKIHPVVALIGVLGGLKLFGFLGIIIGPLIAALFIAIGEFFYEDYVKDKH
jgi:predicted PurR-regulated permease PerM